MGIEQSLPQALQEALSKGLLKRIPLTFLPYVNQQLSQWNYLFSQRTAVGGAPASLRRGPHSRSIREPVPKCGRA